jgi:hypothetical protein
MSFKEMINEDIKGIFINLEEFGELHIIGGKEMTVIIDEMEIAERSKKQTEKGRIEGIYKRQTILYVAQCDFGKQPGIGSVLTVDENHWRVIEVNSEGGIYSITLGYLSS